MNNPWKPIADAPRDGTPIDLWHKGGFRLCDNWWTDDGWSGVWTDDDLTHYMDIPPEPACDHLANAGKQITCSHPSSMASINGDCLACRMTYEQIAEEQKHE